VQDLHVLLERRIAEFHNREASIVYASCYDANAGLFEALLSTDDAVISDELNHASIIDGIRLCRANRLRYAHRDMTGTLTPSHSFIHSVSAWCCISILYTTFIHLFVQMYGTVYKQINK